MASPDRLAQPDTHRSEQGVLNRSFDETYQVLATEQLGFDGTAMVRQPVGAAGLVTGAYDYISIPSYNANGDPLSVVYKRGGSGGTTVATLTLTYDGDGNISTVART